MKVTVTFDSRDDIEDNRSRIEGVVLTVQESATAQWTRTDAGQYSLSYQTSRGATEVVSDWEAEGFEIDDFASFCFSATS